MGATLSLILTQEKQDTVNNKSYVKAVVKVTATGATYNSSSSCPVKLTGAITAEGTHGFGQSKTTTLLTKYAWITHGSDGKKTITVNASYNTRVSPGTISASKTLKLTDIPRQATITSATNFNDTGNPTITYKNPAGSAVDSLVARIEFNSDTPITSYKTLTKTGSSYTFTLTDAERDELRQHVPNAKTCTVYFRVRTKIGTAYYHSRLAKTLTITGGNPTLPSNPLSYTDSNTSVSSITGSTPFIVESMSNLVLKCKKATAYKYATISSYTFTFNGITKTGSVSNTDPNIIEADFGKITNNAITDNCSLNASVTVRDSRGYEVSASLPIPCSDYYKPDFIDLDAARCNADHSPNLNGEWLKITCNVSIASVRGKNNRTVVINGLPGGSVSITGGVGYVNLNDGGNGTYTMTGVVTDRFGYTDAYSRSVAVQGSSRIININSYGTGVAIGKKSEATKDKPMFEVNWDTKLNEDIILKSGKSLYDTIDYIYGTPHILENTKSSFNIDWIIDDLYTYLIGNTLRVYIKATRANSSNPVGAGNISNDFICTVTVNHGGKIKDLYNTSGNSAGYGGVAVFYTDSIEHNADKTATSFRIILAATHETISGTTSTYMNMPATIDWTKY